MKIFITTLAKIANGRGWRAQDKDKDKDEETNMLLKEMKSTKMDNIEKQFSSKVDSVYGSLEKNDESRTEEVR